ncbi:SAM-dependent methyltransferase [Nocardia cyriacigeorgica]|uniref:SAM-dependent methyltransferase n=1 Tax=Nocardia cyriacigeorgica TaxID=135487 RepID=UPI0018931F85|nr:SAM-dependent methyltransferase [Nocardia cyriacigeorgica]MBF6399217.1 SAM-dependent methyltransferase [Nocardia cyriacigeorgica]MBF6404848.1 SAM-dependent methyltransferase [Nocardia cyriacigeorgica]
MSEPDRTTVLDQSQPNSARIHSALLGGKDSYTADQAIADSLARGKIAPAITESRRFALRAVAYLIDHHQVTQFVELGCGFPHAPNIHDVAGDRVVSARTLYIDNDPIAATHARALMTEHATHTAEIDLTDTTAVVEAITTVLDTSAPIALSLSGTAELIADPAGTIAALASALPAPTWLVLTHISADIHGHDINSAAETLRAAGIAYQPRSHADITELLAGYRLYTPGLITPHRWRPDPIHPGRYDHATEPCLPFIRDLSAYAAIGQWCRT